MLFQAGGVFVFFLCGSIVGLGPGGLGFETGYTQVINNPFHKGIQSEPQKH